MTLMKLTKPDIGIGVIVIVVKENKILMGKRLKEIGFGKWQFPGGHLEKFETFQEAAKREVYEETGMIIKSPFVATYAVNIWEEFQQHYVNFWVVAKWDSGEPINKEEDKCEGWNWIDYEDFLLTLHGKQSVPGPLFEITPDVFEKCHPLVQNLRHSKTVETT